MYHSTEIRWFSKKSAIFETIFKAIPGITRNQPVRTDHYLLTGSEILNIKLREGMLEVKWREKVHPQYKIRQIELGNPEDWIKISFGESEPVITRKDRLSDSEYNWVAVKKMRMLKFYEIDPSDHLIPVPADKYISAGCQLEYSELAIWNESLYSFNFEVFGAPETNYENFLKTLRSMENTNSFVSLADYPSCGYPAFLAT